MSRVSIPPKVDALMIEAETTAAPTQVSQMLHPAATARAQGSAPDRETNRRYMVSLLAALADDADPSNVT